MSPSPNRQAVFVGLFLIASVAILAGAILMIGNLNDTFTRKLTVTAVFDEVSGLTKGDNVWFSGVKVGVVTRLRFHESSQVEIEMKLDRDAARFIHRDALAKISSDGLIGNQIVVVYGGTTDAARIAEGDELAIGEAISAEAIMATFQANNVNLLAVTTDLKALTAGLVAGHGTAGRLLTEDALYGEVAETVANLHVASTSASAFADSLAVFSADLNREGTLAKSLVNDRTSYASLTDTVAQFNEVSVQAGELVDGLASGVDDPKSPVGTLLHDSAAGADVRATLQNLNVGSALLAEDLEAAQHNFLLRRYFKKRDKQEKADEREAKESAVAETP